ncbi:hypothetical protein [Xenorhabdus ehlersii]|uniref:Uncharacterized protein n=1 Tax=Xenorhabdus ehlersii TaxID=290111 RepID=A0A2D0IKY0_9GAMM|nr:hypothetical protein [Xenorhabdus ehlersii]PHM22458.1 hypothetical protein Xehl_03604 [Xenorhabdus ehlersii]RKE88708.1 hypothetical protein BDE27_3360 [Xenorhabdus ehlersii]
MSDDIFILENVNAALKHYSIGNGIENGLYPHSPAYWCAEQVSKLTDDERKEALFRLSVWDLIDVATVTIKKLCQSGSDAWHYSIVETLADNSKNDLLVSACAIWGWGLTMESDSTSYHLAASNLVFAVLAQEQYDSDTLNEFENLDIKNARRKAGKIRSEQRDGALKDQCIKWAEDITKAKDYIVGKEELAESVYDKYVTFIIENPKGTDNYTLLHPIDKRGTHRPQMEDYRTIYKWVSHLTLGKRARKKK